MITIVFPLTVEACVDESVDVVGMPYLVRVVTGSIWAEADHLAGKEAVIRTQRPRLGLLADRPCWMARRPSLCALDRQPAIAAKPEWSKASAADNRQNLTNPS